MENCEMCEMKRMLGHIPVQRRPIGADEEAQDVRFVPSSWDEFAWHIPQTAQYDDFIRGQLEELRLDRMARTIEAAQRAERVARDARNNRSLWESLASSFSLTPGEADRSR